MIRKFIASQFKSQLQQTVQYNFSKVVTLKLPDYDSHRLDSYELPTHAQTTGEELLNYFEEMTLMRAMEVQSDILYKKKLIRGFCHLYDGQEAVVEGMEAALNLQDMVITAYRCHCTAYKRGSSIREILAEMMGKKTGTSHGKGGSMHFYRKSHNFYGGNGIVGAQLPVGTGLGFAIKYQGKPNVAVTMYGDGASNQGQLFEAANMAYLWKLPVLFVCENNKYAMGTSIERHAMNTKFYTRGDTIPGIRMNGNNLFHVREGFKWAKDYSLKNGPMFIEVESYRYHGHSMSDPGLSYRTREEVQEYRKTKDCINYIKNIILQESFATENELKEIEKKCKNIINEAVEQAIADPFPKVEEDLFTDVYAHSDRYFLRGVEYQNSKFQGSSH